MRLLPRLVALAFLFGTPALAAPIPPGCEEDAVACKEDCTIEYGGNGNAIRKLTRCFEGCTNTRSQCARKFNAVNGRAADAPEAAPERRQSKTEAAKLREIEEKDRKRDEDPFGDDDKPVRERPARDAYDDPPEPPPERKGYRASEAEAEKKPQKGNPRQTASVPARTSEPPPARTPPPPSPAVAPDTTEPEPTKPDAPDIEAFSEPPPRAEPPAPRPTPKPVVAQPAPSSDDTSDDVLAAPVPPVEKKAPPPRPAEAPRPKPPPEPKKDISDWDPNGD